MSPNAQWGELNEELDSFELSLLEAAHRLTAFHHADVLVELHCSTCWEGCIWNLRRRYCSKSSRWGCYSSSSLEALVVSRRTTHLAIA